MKKSVLKFSLVVLFLALIVSLIMPCVKNDVVVAEAYNLTAEEALAQFPFPHTGQLRKYRVATQAEIDADAARDADKPSELFMHQGVAHVIFGARKYSYFYAIVSNAGEFTEVQKDSNNQPLYDADGNILFTAYFNNNYLTANPKDVAKDLPSQPWFNKVLGSIVSLFGDALIPVFVILGSIAAVFIIILSVKFARAETAEQRETSKKHLIGLIVGIVAVILLMVLAQIFSGQAETIFDWIKSFK